MQFTILMVAFFFFAHSNTLALKPMKKQIKERAFYYRYSKMHIVKRTKLLFCFPEKKFELSYSSGSELVAVPVPYRIVPCSFTGFVLTNLPYCTVFRFNC